jgi:diaminohydroxyphosphoribosylaminopyrimidine deaminase/5-amino-6-(5-phosphoribosylamino)uracil reductase
MEDKKIMQMVLRLALKGEGKVSPNPMVGAVIINDDKIVGSGYYQRFGGHHAEINALKKAGKRAKGGTLYVNLEPHSFIGKTHPCTEAIIKAGVRKVFCSMVDPNPLVNGKGVKRLKESGIKVEVGLLGKGAKRLNEVYLKYMTTGFPFVILKVAQTLDGKIATSNGDSKWITSEDSREFVYKLRSKVDAVLVGSKTIVKDNPELTLHRIKGKNPKTIVLTSSGKIPPTSKILRSNRDNKTIIVTSKASISLNDSNVEIWKIKENTKGRIDLRQFLRKAGQEGISSILVEGGREIFTSFSRERLVDKIYYFLSTKILGKGLETFGDLGINRIKDSLKLKDVGIKRFSNDFLLTGYPDWSK